MDALVTTLALPLRMSDNRASDPGVLEDDILSMAQAIGERTLPSTADLGVLVRRGQRGDMEAIERLYEAFKRPVFAIAFRYTSNSTVAEDLLQDIFLKVFSHLKDVHDIATFPAWVYRIAVNACFSHLRQKQSAGRDPVSLTEIEGGMAGAVYDRHERSLKGPLEEAIRELPPGLRGVFVLHDVQGFKHEEIARILGCTTGTSKSQLFKARARLREILRRRQVV